jgi:membrane protein DedA with SNARE-associated domain
LLRSIATYGYPAMALLVVVGSAGLPLPLGVLLAALGALSVVRGGPSLVLLIAVGIGASVVGDLLDYGFGRVGLTRLGWRVVGRRRQRSKDLAARTSALLRRRLGLFIFVTRFAPALTVLASPISAVAGASGMLLGIFVFWDLAGETVFAAGNTLLGRFFGTAITTPSLLVPGLVALVGVLVLALVVLPRVRRRLITDPPPNTEDMAEVRLPQTMRTTQRDADHSVRPTTEGREETTHRVVL